ncbi:MAG: hypothetical protein ACI9BF_000575 [Candidatus Paceibacteria bacterium]|jgi:hypothetical protein
MHFERLQDSSTTPRSVSSDYGWVGLAGAAKECMNRARSGGAV